MIYDCFIFNSELDLLELRLNFLENHVDYFVLVESKRTLSGNSKPLFFYENRSRFNKFKDKIIYLEAPLMPNLPSWEYEYFQRNYIKEGLKECHPNDIIFLSDVDEILNLPTILRDACFKLPILIELPVYYYFINLKSNCSYKVNLAANYRDIKNIPIGDRKSYYKSITQTVLCTSDCKTGWHFSYLFGFNLDKFIEKIESFSHQEFNNLYYLDKSRILRCIQNGIDLYERYEINYSFKSSEDYAELKPFILTSELNNLVFRPSLFTRFNPINIIFRFRIKTLPLIRNIPYTLNKMLLNILKVNLNKMKYGIKRGIYK
ncbi:glycosyltransferase family 17 protein [Pontibacter fetidus]|uniref:Glycosyl transferase family 17 n=1 Tax=Pontibacter fetidus TaxID=2700082 RepID=A0A6B2H2J3_9BACT|nr:hypothetical protein [Pontibacter fetidus]NDK56318.1 hypothetical protein [Pontibacter fetidus]